MWNVGGYALPTAALAVTARRILRGEIRERGVVHSEAVFEPLPFFGEVVAGLRNLRRTGDSSTNRSRGRNEGCCPWKTRAASRI
jgi:hypothetical protein